MAEVPLATDAGFTRMSPSAAWGTRVFCSVIVDDVAVMNSGESYATKLVEMGKEAIV